MLRLTTLLLLLCALAFSGVANGARKQSTRTTAAARAAAGMRVADYARRQIGVPYRYGGTSPRSGFDCSGLVRYVYAHFGIRLPHSSYAQFGLGRRVSRGHLRPGDLVFFSGVGHVGIYVGRGRFIHAPHSGTRVQVSRLSDHGSYDGARRIARAH
jgi:cell wall-associated NlpC family hydrolase